MSITIDNINPINLSAQMITEGVRLFYGTVQVEGTLDDVFPETTALTYVTLTINNDAGVTIDVQFDTQSPITVGPRGSTSKTISMPAAGSCNSMNVTVWSAGTKHHDPIIRLKRKLGSVTPSCN